jgi:hypothetical protein
MQNPTVLLLLGLVLCGLAIREFARAMKTGGVRLRGGAMITQERSPRLFWINMGFDIVTFCLGFALAVWSLFRGALS